MKFVNFRREDSFDYAVERVCKNCNHIFAGRYCNRCGEKVNVPEDKSIVQMLLQFINGLTFLDSRFFRTIRLMFFRTGELSVNFINGVRVSFIRPISLFFFANLLYFLFPVFDTFNSSLRTQMNFSPHSEIARSMVEKRIAAENITLKDFTLQYNQQSTNMAKLLLIVFVFLVAVPLALLNYSSGFYFHDHLLVSLEFNSMMIIVVQVLLPRLLMMINYIAGSPEFLKALFTDSFFSLISAFFIIGLFYFMEKRVYVQSNARALVKSALMVPSIFIAVQVYRVILFFATMTTL